MKDKNDKDDKKGESKTEQGKEKERMGMNSLIEKTILL